MKTPSTPGTKPALARKAKTPRVTVKKDEGPLVAFDATKVGRDYRMVDTYKVGERLEHTTFGRGVVELIAGPRKIQVWFEGRDVLPSERRTLAHSYLAQAPAAKVQLERRRLGGGQGF